MIIKHKNIAFSVGIPFLASAAFFLAGNMRVNYLWAMLFSTLHEAGHIFAMLYFGKKPDRITFGVMGIKIEKSDMSLSYSEECITALCGPMVNLVFAMIFAFIDKSGLPFAINAGLLIVNILPVNTLDGGRFIYNFLLFKTDEEKALKVMNVLELITAFLITAVLIVSLVTGFVNTSFVLFAVFFVIIIVSELIVNAKSSTHG